MNLPKTLKVEDEKVKKLNNFISRYLKHQGYINSLSVFIKETAMNENINNNINMNMNMNNDIFDELEKITDSSSVS